MSGRSGPGWQAPDGGGTGGDGTGTPGAGGGWTAPGNAAPGNAAPGNAAPGYAAPGYAAPEPPASPAAYPAAPGTPPPWTSALAAHKPGIVALRPLSIGDIVEGSFAALRRNPRTFLGLALLVSLAVLLLIGVLALAGYAGVLALDGSERLDVFLAFGLTSAAVLLMVVSVFTSIGLAGMLAYPVGEAVLGRKPSIAETWQRTRGKLLRLFGLSLLLTVPATVAFGILLGLAIWAFSAGDLPALGVLGVLGLLAATVAAVWVGVRVALATPALVLEDLGVMASVRRSWTLTRGLFWRTLGTVFATSALVGIVQYVLSFMFQILGMLLGLALAGALGAQSQESVMLAVVIGTSAVGGLLSGLVTQPFMAAVLALLYTDARIRREGFDLALVRAASGQAGRPAASPPAVAPGRPAASGQGSAG